MARVTNHIYLEDLDGSAIKFKNFAGAYVPNRNAAGDRNFNVEIPEDMADALAADGWNVKPAEDKVRDDGSEVHYGPRIKVKLKYNKEKNLMPRVAMDCRGQMIDLTEETIHRLDDMRILHVKAIDISPYNFDVNGKTGVSAYLNKMRVEVAPDMFID